jgi:hypothetical protein
MTDYSNDRYAQLAATAFGYAGLSRGRYRELCAAIRISSDIDFTDWQPCWGDLSAEQQITLLDNLKHAFPSVRDGAAFLSFIRHMMVVVRGEAARRAARNADTSHPSATSFHPHSDDTVSCTAAGEDPQTDPQTIAKKPEGRRDEMSFHATPNCSLDWFVLRRCTTLRS